MRVSIPEYLKPIAKAGSEAVLSTPGWYGKHGTHATLFVDAHRWPPQITSHAMRVDAAARFPDGRWACVTWDDGWFVDWFADIHASARVARAPVPFAYEPDDADDCPVDMLVVFGDRLHALVGDGTIGVYDDGAWHHVPQLAHAHSGRTVRYLGDVEMLELDEMFVDPRYRAIDDRDCSTFIRAAGVLIAWHGNELVEVTEAALLPRLPGHQVAQLEAGPADTLFVAFARDTARGTSYEYVLYDPREDTVQVLPETIVASHPTIVAVTADGGLVLHDEHGEEGDRHALVVVPADQLRAVPKIPARSLALPPRIALDVFDTVGAASRPLVATTGEHIAIALGHDLRMHSVDRPTTVVSHANPLVAVAAMHGRFAAIDDAGVLHTYDTAGAPLGSRYVAAPRSLAVVDGAWAVIAKDRIVLVGARETRTIEIAGPIAVAEDPDGELVIVCDDNRLAVWHAGELRDLPPTIEQLIAIVALGERVFTCLGRQQLYALDLANPELVSLDTRLRRPRLASDASRGRRAQCETASSVAVIDPDGPVSSGAVNYSTYSEPAEVPVTVHGLAFMDDGRLVILLDAGRGNIITPDTGAALKLDPQPGDDPSRWLFISGGQILIA